MNMELEYAHRPGRRPRPERSQYRQLAERAGHSIEWHTGDLAGRGAGTLEALIERSDLVIVVTRVNSHGAVWRARKLAKLRSKRLMLLARWRRVQIRSLLAELSSPARRGSASADNFNALAVWDGAGLQSHASQVRFLGGAPVCEHQGGAGASPKQPIGRCALTGGIDAFENGLNIDLRVHAGAVLLLPHQAHAILCDDVLCRTKSLAWAGAR